MCRNQCVSFLLSLLLLSILIVGCSPGGNLESRGSLDVTKLNSYWPNSVFYEIFVMSFYDSTGDGIGDINGVTQKLDYLQDLGIEGIWLMPVNPSPSYHKYDVIDYYDIDPQYGTIDDFKHFIKEAHSRNIKVIMDLVVNHSSSKHPWFIDALTSVDSKYRDWYLWADSTNNINERGEWNQQLWHGHGSNKYYGVFWSEMPDLNFDNPEVREEFIRIGQFWLEEVGVDGFRLDAAKHVFPDKEKEKNYEWWQEFRAGMEEVKEDVLLVGEVWAPATVVAPYLEDGLHSAFNFDLSEKIISTVKNEKDSGITTSLNRIRSYFLSVSEEYVDSTFITNHDMNRIMSELDGNIHHAKMAASLLLTLPGSPFLYYGEEIGMEGIKPDEHIREPMLWYNEPSNTGQTSWIRQRHNVGEKATSVESQMNEEVSLLRHYKQLIHARRSSEILVRGEIDGVSINQDGILAFNRTLEQDSMLILHNISSEVLTFTLPEKERDNSNIFFTNSDETKISIDKENVSIELAPYSTLILHP
jgi:alpha-amylase